MESSNYPPAPAEDGYAVEPPVGVDPFAFPAAEQSDDYQWYKPSLIARLSHNRGLLILLIIAFLLLVIGPSVFYILNPPRPRPPLPVRGQGIPAINAPAPEWRTPPNA